MTPEILTLIAQRNRALRYLDSLGDALGRNDLDEAFRLLDLARRTLESVTSPAPNIDA